MPPLLHIVRHGQGYHAIKPEGHNVPDPELTPQGVAECDQLRSRFQRHDSVELLVASPMRRTLRTCLDAFAPCVERGLKIIAQPYAQEITANPSDTGTDIATLKTLFDGSIDWSECFDGWDEKKGEMATDVTVTKARAAKLRRWIRDRPEKEVVLVTHGQFAHFLTGDVDEYGKQTTGWWKETELRTYRFDEASEVELAKIVETESGGGRILPDTDKIREGMTKNAEGELKN
ncbi:hypothetical protein MBLNU457_7307t1 [Dothideomycetes sp. NU457]